MNKLREMANKGENALVYIKLGGKSRTEADHREQYREQNGGFREGHIGEQAEKNAEDRTAHAAEIYARRDRRSRYYKALCSENAYFGEQKALQQHDKHHIHRVFKDHAELFPFQMLKNPVEQLFHHFKIFYYKNLNERV